MIKSFEVGAVFKIVDQGSPAIRRMLRDIRSLQKAIAGVNTELRALTGATTVTATATTETAALAAEWRNVSRAAQGARRSITSAAAASAIPVRVPAYKPGGGGRGGRGGGNGGGGLHYNPASLPVPGGHLGYRGGNVALAGAGALGYGAYLAAQQESDVWQMIFHSGMKDTPENRKKFDDIIKSVHSTTGGDLRDIRAAAIEELRMFKGTPGGGVDVLGEMLKAAATEAKVKGNGTSITSAMASLVGLAHMTNQYSPEDIKKLAPVFGFMSSSTAASLTQIKSAAGYAVPLLHSGMGIDPMETMMYLTALQRAGVMNTKSGTWIRELAVRSLPTSKNKDGLSELGLIDDKGKPTWYGEDGKLSIGKLIEIAKGRVSGMSSAEQTVLERKIFGAQGSGAFSVFTNPKVQEQITELLRELPGYKRQYSTFWEDYTGASTSQQAHKSFADLQDTLIQIGTGVLPPVNAALKDFDAMLKGIQDILPKAPKSGASMWPKVGAAALEGAAAGALVGSITGPGALAVGTVTGLVSGGLKAGEIWLGLDSAVDRTKSKANEAAPAVSGLSAAIESLAKAARTMPNLGGATLFPQNYVPPPPSTGGGEKHSDIYLDGEKVGKAMMRQFAMAGSGANRGSPYFDSTLASPASDFVYSQG